MALESHVVPPIIRPSVPRYPRLMRNKATGNIFLVISPGASTVAGTCVGHLAPAPSQWVPGSAPPIMESPTMLGDMRTSLDLSELEDFNGTVTLSNAE